MERTIAAAGPSNAVIHTPSDKPQQNPSAVATRADKAPDDLARCFGRLAVATREELLAINDDAERLCRATREELRRRGLGGYGR